MQYKVSAFNQEEKPADFPCPNVYNRAWIFPGKLCLEKLMLSLGVFTLPPSLRDHQSTPILTWMGIRGFSSLVLETMQKQKIKNNEKVC